MKSINILFVSEARTKLLETIQRVTAGEDVIIVNRRTKQKFQITRFKKKLPDNSELKNTPDPV